MVLNNTPPSGIVISVNINLTKINLKELSDSVVICIIFELNKRIYFLKNLLFAPVSHETILSYPKWYNYELI